MTTNEIWMGDLIINDQESDGLIRLKQKQYDVQFEADVEHLVVLHPIQLRLLAERAGLLPAGDPDAQRVIARLSRQLRILRDRINRLDDLMLGINSDGHYDADIECAYSEASLVIADEFMAQLPDQCQPVTGDALSRVTPSHQSVAGVSHPDGGPKAATSPGDPFQEAR